MLKTRVCFHVVQIEIAKLFWPELLRWVASELLWAPNSQTAVRFQASILTNAAADLLVISVWLWRN